MAHSLSKKKIHFLKYEKQYCDNWPLNCLKDIINDVGAEYSSKLHDSNMVIFHENQKTYKTYKQSQDKKKDCYTYHEFLDKLDAFYAKAPAATLYTVKSSPKIIQKLYRMEVVGVIGAPSRYFRVAEALVGETLVWQPQDCEDPVEAFMTRFQDLTGRSWEDRNSKKSSNGTYTCKVINPSSKLRGTWDEVCKKDKKSFKEQDNELKDLRTLVEATEAIKAELEEMGVFWKKREAKLEKRRAEWKTKEAELKLKLVKNALAVKCKTKNYYTDFPTDDPQQFMSTHQVEVSPHLLQADDTHKFAARRAEMSATSQQEHSFGGIKFETRSRVRSAK